MSKASEDLANAKKKASEASKMLVGGAMNLLNSVAQRAAVYNSPGTIDSTAPVMGSSEKESNHPGDDIPHEELLLLCMKMQKRMQVMETKGQELIKKKVMLLQERKVLLEGVNQLLESSALSSSSVLPPDDQDIDLEALFGTIRSASETRRLKMSSLEQRLIETELAAITSSIIGTPATATTTTTTPEASTEEHQKNLATIKRLEAEVERYRKTEQTMKEQLVMAQDSLRSKSMLLEAGQRDLEASNSKCEEKVLYLQMQINVAKARDEEKDRDLTTLRAQLESMRTQLSSMRRLASEKESAMGDNRDVIQSLQNKIFDLEPEVDRSKEKIREMERNVNAQMLLKAEQDALIAALRRDLHAMIEAREDSVKRVKELEEQKQRADSQLTKMAAVNDQLTVLQAAVEDKTSLITRLRAEAQASDRNHAMRTAMLATTEAQLEALRKEIGVKDDAIRDAENRVSALQTQLTALEMRIEERAHAAALRIQELEMVGEGERKRYADAQAEMRDSHDQAIEATKRDYSKKSSLARALLSDREEEVRVLSVKNDELQVEINSGAPNERRIFELAELQAKREAIYGQHSDTRELAFQQMQATLAARDLDLARVQQSHTALAAEVSELRRHTKREDVNMDYLKNVVLQYMSFPVQAPERGSLVPVIAMLLQFNVKEVNMVESALKEPVWGQIPVKEVKRQLNRVSLSPYSTNNNNNNNNSNNGGSGGLLTAATTGRQQRLYESKTKRSSNNDSKDILTTEISI